MVLWLSLLQLLSGASGALLRKVPPRRKASLPCLDMFLCKTREQHLHSYHSVAPLRQVLVHIHQNAFWSELRKLLVQY